jgi:hypothetical protein
VLGELLVAAEAPAALARDAPCAWAARPPTRTNLTRLRFSEARSVARSSGGGVSLARIALATAAQLSSWATVSSNLWAQKGLKYRHSGDVNCLYLRASQPWRVDLA